MSNDTKKNRRVIFADLGLSKYQSVMESLHSEGVQTDEAVESSSLFQQLNEKNYEVCILNLLIGGMGPFELISGVRAASKNKNIRIIVVSRQVQKINIHNTIKAGANDFVADPFDNESLKHRILYHLKPVTMIEPEGYEERPVSGKTGWDYLNILLECSEILSRAPKGNEHSAFMQILGKVAGLLESNRTSLVLVEKETNTGVVLASSDDATFYDFPISLTKYPEIMHVLNSGNFVLVEDVTRNVLTKNIQRQVRSIQIASLLVFPIRYHNEVIGVLTIKRPHQRSLPGLDEMRIIQAIANTMAAHSNVRAILRKVYREFSNKSA